MGAPSCKAPGQLPKRRASTPTIEREYITLAVRVLGREATGGGWSARMNARVLPRVGGARRSAGAADRASAPELRAPRAIGPAAFMGVALTSFGGPLALAALMVPAAVAQARSAAGFATPTGALVFVAPLAIWLACDRGTCTVPAACSRSWRLPLAGRLLSSLKAWILDW